MQFIKYEIQKGDTIESIAKDNSLDVDDLIKFHNKNCGITNAIITNKIPIHLEYIFLPKNIAQDNLKSKDNENDDIATYRCEQTVITKLNGIPTNTADTKREYVVKKRVIQNFPVVEINMTDQVILVNPNQYQDTILLVADLDNVKCNGIVVGIDAKSGNIQRIINQDYIINQWELHKRKLEDGYSFLRNQQAADAIKTFIGMAENQILNEEILIEDLKTKMFFDVFFDKYLVNSEDKFEPYTRKFYSQLFLGEIIDLHIKQDLLRETEDKILVRKVSTIDKEVHKSKHLEKQYNEKYKPVIQYRFSEYNISYRERIVYDEATAWLESAEITIIEEVKNNIQLLVNYKLKKIE